MGIGRTLRRTSALNRTQEVVGSSPISSTKTFHRLLTPPLRTRGVF